MRQTAEGNPLFMEELIQSFFDEGVMVRSNGTVKIGKSLREIRIPSTVEGIIAARIDRLPAEDKALLQMLAAIGIEFPCMSLDTGGGITGFLGLGNQVVRCLPRQ